MQGIHHKMTGKQIEGLKAVAYNSANVEAVRKLQHLYGYYLEKCLCQQAVDLFDDNGTIVFFGGIYHWKPGLKRLYLHQFRKTFTGGRNGPIKGNLSKCPFWIVHSFLLNHFQLRDVIDVFPEVEQKPVFAVSCKPEPTILNPSSAIIFPMVGTRNLRERMHSWSEIWYFGKYVWWIIGLDIMLVERIRNGIMYRFRQNHILKILVESSKNHLWPETEVVPFHYAHLVTGEQLTEEELAAPAKSAS